MISLPYILLHFIFIINFGKFFSLVRVDFNQSLLDYHTGIDAVLLAGYKPKITAQLNNLQKQTFDDNVSEILEVRRTIHESESDNSYDSTDTNRKCEGFLSLPV